MTMIAFEEKMRAGGTATIQFVDEFWAAMPILFTKRCAQLPENSTNLESCMPSTMIWPWQLTVTFKPRPP